MDQSYDTNFSKTALMFSEQIYLEYSEYKILLNVPSLKKWLNIKNYNLLVALLKEEKYWSNEAFQASNRIEVICGINKFGKVYTDMLDPWPDIFPNLTIDTKGILCENKYISIDSFNLITDMLMVGCGVISYDDFSRNYKTSKEDDDDVVASFKKKMAQASNKIKKIKGDKDVSYPLEKMFICILSFFPQYTLETLKELNYFTIVLLFEWAQKRSIQEVNNIAAGSGNLKKYEPLF